MSPLKPLTVVALTLSALCLFATAARADIYRWDNGELIPGTEGIEPGPGVQLDHRQLEFAALIDIDLSGATFVSSNLANAHFDASSMNNASLSFSSLANSVFSGTVLENTNLSNADLTNAVFAFTDTTGTHFENALVPGPLGGPARRRIGHHLHAAREYTPPLSPFLRVLSAPSASPR